MVSAACRHGITIAALKVLVDHDKNICSVIAAHACMLILKVHKRENFFGSDFELYTFL